MLLEEHSVERTKAATKVRLPSLLEIEVKSKSLSKEQKNKLADLAAAANESGDGLLVRRWTLKDRINSSINDN